MIVQAVAALPAAEAPGLRTTAGLQVDRILASAVEGALETGAAHVG